jgi:hypothetical protein
MKHKSLADFTNKVTNKELCNITINRITCVTLFGIPFCFSSKGNLPPCGKKPKGVRYCMQILKIRENKNVLHAAI